MKQRTMKRTVAMVTLIAMLMALLSGCGSNDAEDEVKAQGAGAVLLSVNPEIEVEYDDKGLVLEIEGINEDGKSVVAGISDYEGETCQTIINLLIKEIYEAGFFDKTVEGHTKNIVLKMEKGSAIPEDDFLENVAEGVRETVKSCGFDSETVTVQEGDLDDQGYIGQDKAKELVLAQLGLPSASFNNHEYNLDDGVYEFEFSADGVEYEYEVDAVTGKILEADFEGNDDWDDMDDWDDWDDDDDQDDDDDDQDDDRDDRDDDDDDRDDDRDDRDDDDDKDDDDED